MLRQMLLEWAGIALLCAVVAAMLVLTGCDDPNSPWELDRTEVTVTSTPGATTREVHGTVRVPGASPFPDLEVR